jgi:hypothetical protein
MSQMRAPENNAKGTSGQSFVKGQFEELGWGAVPNLEHDLGTDLWIAARDARRFDLRALVGAQVKNWALEFDASDIHDGQHGWWFADTEAHFEYWLGHRIPHLVVLYDKDGKVSYWVHVTLEAVVSTGKNRKIFVPKAQTVDTDHFDDLVKVATSVLPGVTWEGSAWSPGQEIPHESQLRYALIAPRLIAPHGNASIEEVTAAQAIALTTAVRLSDLRYHYLEKQPLLDPEVSLKAHDPEWQLYAALLMWTEKELLDSLRQLPVDDERPNLRAAKVAVLAAALFEEGNVRDAVEILERALGDHDDYNPVDHAWLTMHLARNLVQTGQVKRAQELALEVAPIGQRAHLDPTARLLSGVASDMIFSLSGWQAGDIASTIQARDTAASWWRSQIMTSGLTKHLEAAFKSWANDQSVTFNASDETWAKLRSAMLISGHAADTPNWRYETSLLAQHILMLEPGTDQVISALNLLRFAGLDKELKLAINRMLDRGPTDPLERVATDIDLDFSTRDSLQSDLEILGLSGPILTEVVADHAAMWLIDELKNSSERVQALGIRFLYTDHLVKALWRVYIACSRSTQAAVRSHVAALPMIEDQSHAHEYAILVGRVDDDDWTEEQIRALKLRPVGDNFELQYAIQTLVAGRDPAFRLTLADRIKDGDTHALASWDDVRDLPADVATEMLIHTAAEVGKEVESARAGAYAFGGDSALRRLVLLNVWYPEVADWAPVVETLSEKRSHPNDLAPGLQLMVLYARRVPAEVVEQLRIPLQSLAITTPDTQFGSFPFGRSDLRGDAVLLLASLFPDDVSEDLLMGLLRGASEQMAAAVRIVANRQHVTDLPLFAALATNTNADVRAAVAAALADWVSVGLGGTAPLDLLKSLLDEPGVQLAARVTRSVAQQEKSSGAEALLELLGGHQSATVRNHVRIIRRRWSVSSQ